MGGPGFKTGKSGLETGNFPWIPQSLENRVFSIVPAASSG
jgi:hypothetical protein